MSHRQRIIVYTRSKELLNVGIVYAVVAQLVRALVCGTRGRRFESHQPYQERLISALIGDFLPLAPAHMGA